MSLSDQKETTTISEAWAAFRIWHQQYTTSRHGLKLGTGKGSRASNELLESARDKWTDQLKRIKCRPFSWPTTSEEINELQAILSWRATEMWSTVTGYCRIMSDEPEFAFDPGRTNFTTWHKEVNGHRTNTESLRETQEAAEVPQPKPPKVPEDLDSDRDVKKSPVTVLSPHLFCLSPFSSHKIWSSGDEAQALRNFAVRKWYSLSKEFYAMVMEYEKDMQGPLRNVQSKEEAERILNGHLNFLLKLAHQIYQDLEIVILNWDGKEKQDEKEDTEPEQDKDLEVKLDGEQCHDREGFKTEKEANNKPTTGKSENKGGNESKSPQRRQNRDKKFNENRRTLTPAPVIKEREISTDDMLSESDAEDCVPRRPYKYQRERLNPINHSQPSSPSLPRRRNREHLPQNSSLNESSNYRRPRAQVHRSRYLSRMRPYSYPDSYSASVDEDDDQVEPEWDRVRRRAPYPFQTFHDPEGLGDVPPHHLPREYYAAHRRDPIYARTGQTCSYPDDREIPIEIDPVEGGRGSRERRNQYMPVDDQSHFPVPPRSPGEYRSDIGPERLRTFSKRTAMKPVHARDYQSPPSHTQHPDGPQHPKQTHHPNSVLPRPDEDLQLSLEQEDEMKGLFQEIELAYAKSAKENAKALDLDTLDIVDSIHHRMEEGRAGYDLQEAVLQESSGTDSHLFDTSDTELSSMIESSENQGSDSDTSSTPTPSTPVVDTTSQRDSEDVSAISGRNGGRSHPFTHTAPSYGILPRSGILAKRTASAVQTDKSVHWARAPEIKIFHKTK